MKQPLLNSDSLKMPNAKLKWADWFWIKNSDPQADGTSEPVPSQQGQSTAAAHLNPLQSGCNAQQVILVPLQKASTHSLKNNYQTIEHHFYVCSDCVPKVRGYTRGPRQPPPYIPRPWAYLKRRPRTRPQRPNPIDSPPTHFKLRYGVFEGVSALHRFYLYFWFIQFSWNLDFFMRCALTMRRLIQCHQKIQKHPPKNWRVEHRFLL